jgi:hypothetical protein
MNSVQRVCVAAILGLAVPAGALAGEPGAGGDRRFGKVEAYQPLTGTVTIGGQELKLSSGATSSLDGQLRALGIKPTSPFAIEYAEQPDNDKSRGSSGGKVIGTVTVLPES